MEALPQENLSLGVCKQKSAGQPLHPHIQIITFVIHLFASTVSSLITNEISLFLLVAVAEEIGVCLALSKTPKTCFLVSMPIHDYPFHAFEVTG